MRKRLPIVFLTFCIGLMPAAAVMADNDAVIESVETSPLEEKAAAYKSEAEQIKTAIASYGIENASLVEEDVRATRATYEKLPKSAKVLVGSTENLDLAEAELGIEYSDGELESYESEDAITESTASETEEVVSFEAISEEPDEIDKNDSSEISEIDNEDSAIISGGNMTLSEESENSQISESDHNEIFSSRQNKNNEAAGSSRTFRLIAMGFIIIVAIVVLLIVKSKLGDFGEKEVKEKRMRKSKEKHKEQWKEIKDEPEIGSVEEEKRKLQSYVKSRYSEEDYNDDDYTDADEHQSESSDSPVEETKSQSIEEEADIEDIEEYPSQVLTTKEDNTAATGHENDPGDIYDAMAAFFDDDDE